MQIDKQLNDMLTTSSSLGYSQALVDVIDQIESVRKECEGDDGASHYVYILLSRLKNLRMRSFEVGREINKPAIVVNP